MAFGMFFSGLGVCLTVCATAVYGAESDYRDVKDFTVEKQARTAEGTRPEVCAAFKVDRRRIMRILRDAREVDSRTYAKDLDAAPCSIEGSVTLKNGLVGAWQIEMSGRGRIEFEDHHVTLIFCQRCGSPFTQ